MVLEEAVNNGLEAEGGVGFCRGGLTEKIKNHEFGDPVRDREVGISYSLKWTGVSESEYGSEQVGNFYGNADLFDRHN